MTLEDIKRAVRNGKTVCWGDASYKVTSGLTRDGSEYWMICHKLGYSIGLTWADGVTMNGKPEEFFIK